MLVDSDTIWTTDTLRELVKPFADATIGGVTTNQRIIDPDRNVLTRWADWLENIRVEYSMPAMSVLGQVGCLPGRTIAFRRQVLVDAMPGVPLRALPRRVPRGERRPDAHEPVPQAGLQGRLPVDELRLHRRAGGHAQDGQATAPVGARQSVQHAADAPVDDAQHTDVGALLRDRHHHAVPVAGLRERLRRARCCMGENVNFYEGSRTATAPRSAPRSSSSSRCSPRGSRSTSARRATSSDHPRDLILLPAFTLLNTFMLMPIRIWGFMRMARNDGWGTRANAFHGDEARTAQSNPWGRGAVRPRGHDDPDGGCVPWLSAARS